VAPVPAHAYFVASAFFHYLGPAFAVLLFERMDVLGVAWLRIASAAAILAVWRRPWVSFRTSERGVILAWGAVLAAMNVCFYISIDRLPLSTVAAIEFLGPIALAVVGTRTARNGLALVLAVVGVFLLMDVHLEGEPLGFVFAGLNAILFAAYIVLGHRVAQAGGRSSVDGLAAAMVLAALIVSPVGASSALTAVTDPLLLAAGLGVGVTSSVIPYIFDQLAMARMRRATYALLLSLLPATATTIGVIVLTQWPGSVELGGIGLVIAGVAIHREREGVTSALDDSHGA